MFDRQKIMFNILNRESKNLGILKSDYTRLSGDIYPIWFMHFTMDIPIE